MISKDQEKIIIEIERLQAQLVADMEAALPAIFTQLSDEVIGLVSELSLDPNDRAKTLRETIALKRKISDTLVENAAYQAAVASVVGGFEKMAKLTDDYMGLILDDYTRKKDLYNAILRVNIDQTKNLLLGAGVRDNFGAAIQEVLKAFVSGVGTTPELQKVLRSFIKGSSTQKPFLERYIKQTTSDAVMVFNREYINSISEDLDIKHYLYAGIIVSDSRDFCKARTGRGYTRKEVEAWASLGKWQGRMPNTTKTTIFSYCGGYNCQHELYPISLEQYAALKKQKQTGVK
jgi:hypothetical protein